MIVNAIINLVYVTISGIIALFPAGSGFPQAVHTSAIALGGYLDLLSPLVPVATLFSVVSLVFIFEISLFGFRTLRWLLGFIPFIGGK